MTTRRSLATIAVVLLILVAGAALLYAARAQVPATVVSSTSSPTPTALPTPQGVYLSKKLGFALELPLPWRQASCLNSDPVGTRLPASEQFTSAVPMEEFIGHVGSPNDRVEVTVQGNPQGISPIAFAAGPDAIVLGAPRSVTFAGRPAAEVQASGPSGEPLAYYVAEGDRMYAVLYRTDRSASDPVLATMQRIIRSFRFLSAVERQALPEPTPITATSPTAPALAGMLASAFQQKDFAALERLLSSCVSYGVQQGGGSLITRQLFMAGLRTQFANGLTVTVDANATRTGTYDGETVTYIRSRWNAMPPGDLRPPPSPGQTAQNVDLMLYPTRGGLYWHGNLLVGGAATDIPATPAATRPFAFEDRYGWLLPADSAATSWRVVRETDRATVSTIFGDGPVASPDGRSIAYWSPAGVRRELRVVSSLGGGERLLRLLSPDEVGNAIAWSTDGTGIAVGVDSTAIPRGGIDPPPLYSAVRIVEVRDGAVRELTRKAETRLRPFGWVRSLRIVAVAEQAGLGRITAYLRVGEDGAVRVTAFNNPDCSRSIALRLDSAGTTVLSVNPMFCFDGSGAFQGAASVRLWPLDDPSAMRTLDVGRVYLVDARFRPGATDVVTVTQPGPPGPSATVLVQLWSGGIARTLAEQRTALAAEPPPFVFRPEGDRALFVWSAEPPPAIGTRVAWLIDVASGDAREVSPPPSVPHASLWLDP